MKYFITQYLAVDRTDNPETIKALEKAHNCFETEERAQMFSEAVRRLGKIYNSYGLEGR